MLYQYPLMGMELSDLHLFLKNNFIFIFGCIIAACRLSLVAESGSYCLAPMLGLLIAVALGTSFRHVGFSSYGSLGSRARVQQLWCLGFAVPLYVRLNPHSLHWKANSQPLCHQGSSRFASLILLLWSFKSLLTT